MPASRIQAVIFPMDTFTVAKARRWLRRNKLTPIKPVDVKGVHLRFRLENPRNFKRFITKKIEKGIGLIIGFP